MATKTEEQKKRYAEKAKERYAKNAELYREKRRQHYKENREIELEKARIYREENPDKVKEAQTKYVENNKEWVAENKKRWNAENADKVKAYYEYHNAKNNKANYEKRKQEMAERRKNDPEYREKCNRWGKENREKRCEYTAKRKSIKLKAMPKWLTDDELNQIKFIYDECHRITNETGIEHHVDHIIPLQGKFVCGLHVPWNLQILTAKENMEKGTTVYDNGCIITA
jgi:hypothetical protein